MAIIDPDGLYNGERMRACSTTARLYWPYIFLQCNGYGRMELDMDAIMRRFITFDPVPARSEIEGVIREYIDHHLLFVYESSGAIWAQWDCRKEHLPRYQNRADLRSPEPPMAEFEAWRGEYQGQKRASRALLSSTLKTPFCASKIAVPALKNQIPATKSPLPAKTSAENPDPALETPISTHGIGVGVGISVEKEKGKSGLFSPEDHALNSPGKRHDSGPAWRRFLEDYPGEVNEQWDAQVFIGQIDTPEKEVALFENLSFWCACDKWQKGFIEKATNFLSKGQWKNRPRGVKVTRSAALKEWKTPADWKREDTEE